MARPYTGKVSTRKVERKQKNGDIYVYEEQRQYDPLKKYTVTISSKLIGVKKKGTNKIVATRARRRFLNVTSTESSPTGEVAAIRRHVGMMDIVNHIAIASGVDDDLQSITDLPTANKVLSLARYVVCSDAHSLVGIEEWQYMHKLPYEDGINKDIYHTLFTELGKDETIQQAFFKARFTREEGVGLFLACDSSTSSTYSKLLTSGIARDGFNKDGDGLPTVKYLVLFSLKTNMPVWFTKLPGNIPDVITVKPIIDELKALNVKKVTLVTDNGYYSEINLGEMVGQGYDFITLGNIRVKWIREKLEEVITSLMNPAHVCPFDIDTHGVTSSSTRTFTWTRTYGSTAKNLKPGDKDKREKKVWLHFFYNAPRKLAEDRNLKATILEAQKQLEDGNELDTMDKHTQNLINSCCHITKKRDGSVNVSFIDDKFQEVCKYHGIFVIISNRKMNCFDCLRWYRRREHIEDFFRRAKQDAHMRHTGVWTMDTLHGRMFVQFVALCLYQYLDNELSRIKAELKEKTYSDGKDKPQTIQNEESKLLNWMDDRSVVRILNWFDAYDAVDISIKLKLKRWSDPVIKRDRLLLEKLGVINDD